MEGDVRVETTAPEPKTLLEAIRYYSDLDIATKAFAALRWPDGPVCPWCGFKRELLRPKPPYLEMQGVSQAIFAEGWNHLRRFPLGLDKWLPRCGWSPMPRTVSSGDSPGFGRDPEDRLVHAPSDSVAMKSGLVKLGGQSRSR